MILFWVTPGIAISVGVVSVAVTVLAVMAFV